MAARHKTSYLASLPITEELHKVYFAHREKIKLGIESYRSFYREYALPLLAEYQTPENIISFQNVYKYLSKLDKKQIEAEEMEKTLLQKEEDKQRQQIEIRQDATDMMAKFLAAIKSIAKDPEALKESGVKPLELYKIIREEEDRAKLVNLRERAENRADYAFAFLVSMARANQLKDEDIQFLEDDIKHELTLFKKKDGIYQLPGDDRRPLEKVVAATTADNSFPDESDSAGIV